MLRGVTSSYVLCMQIEKHRYNLLCHGLANTESYILKSKQDGRKVHLISYILLIRWRDFVYDIKN